MMATPTIDKTQRQIMLLMPLFFVIFIIQFPAGADRLLAHNERLDDGPAVRDRAPDRYDHAAGTGGRYGRRGGRERGGHRRDRWPSPWSDEAGGEEGEGARRGGGARELAPRSRDTTTAAPAKAEEALWAPPVAR
jgi:hypothetical protein